MSLSNDTFQNYSAGEDPFRDITAVIKLDDIPLKDETLPIKLSILTSTFHRYCQLERSLECLARQTWKEFEIIICDDGDTYDLKPIIQKFEPYLRISMYRRERDIFHVDPTAGFRHILPYAKGEIVAIMQPELMLMPDAARFLYEAHFSDQSNAHYYQSGIGTALPYVNGNPKWAALKVFFLSPQMTRDADSVNWHSNLNNLQQLTDFWVDGCGLSNWSNNKWNEYWTKEGQFPWWFIGSARRDDPLWNELPLFRGHAAIDMWLLDYRRLNNFFDVIPDEPMAYHQEHHRMSVSPAGEMERILAAIEEMKIRTGATEPQWVLDRNK